jgi:hypothetical protein
MQVKKLFPTEDIPIDTAGVHTIYGTGFYGQGITWCGGPSTKVTMLQGRKWWSGLQNVSVLLIPFMDFVSASPNIVVISWRAISQNPGQMRTGSLFSRAQSAFYETLGAGTGSNPTLVVNQEHFIEAVFDFTNRQYYRAVDGVVVANTIITTWTQAQWDAIRSTNNLFAIGAYNDGNTWLIRDIAVREYATGESFTPSANLDVERLAMSAGTGSDYFTSNGGNVQDVLSTDYSDILTVPNSSMYVPFVESPKGATAGQLAMAMGNYNGPEGIVRGMEFIMTAKSMDAAPAALTPSFSQNSVAAAMSKQVLTGAFGYRKSLGALSTMPDGSTMTRAKIASGSLILTPSAS